MSRCDCRPPDGGRFPSRPIVPRPCPEPQPRPCFPGGGFLMQRILACGRLHRRRQCYPLCLAALPDCAEPPLTVLEVSVSGAPQWQEAPCYQRGGVTLLVTVPLCLRLRDARGQLFSVPSRLEEELFLRANCAQAEYWRGQIYVQAAVRLAGRATLRCPHEGEVPLEVLIEGYLLSPCAMGGQGGPCCPEPKPWYPQPMFDPYQ